MATQKDYELVAGALSRAHDEVTKHLGGPDPASADDMHFAIDLATEMLCIAFGAENPRFSAVIFEKAAGFRRGIFSAVGNRFRAQRAGN